LQDHDHDITIKKLEGLEHTHHVYNDDYKKIMDKEKMLYKELRNKKTKIKTWRRILRCYEISHSGRALP
jgi:diphthamide biosynthesis methyltransferase